MGMGATDTYFIAFIARQGDLVGKADALEDGTKFMKTIGPFSQNIENKI